MVRIRDTLRDANAAGTIGGAIGTVVGGPIGGLAGKILADALATAVVQAGQKPTNTMDQATAVDAAPDVVQIALNDPRVKQMTEYVDNVTNNDPPSKSIVTQGAVIAGLGGVGTIVATILAVGDLMGYDWSPKTASITLVCTGLITIGGTIYTLYGRWRAKKPLIGT